MAESMWVFPFGKHKGKGIEDVESSYLNWCLGEEWFCVKYPHGAEQITKELGYRKQFGITVPKEGDNNRRSKEEERQNERDSWW